MTTHEEILELKRQLKDAASAFYFAEIAASEALEEMVKQQLLFDSLRNEIDGENQERVSSGATTINIP